MRRSNRKIDDAESGMRSAVAQIQQELDELDARVGTLRGAWTGEASDAYDTAQREWTLHLTNMRALLDDYGTRLQRINDRYRVASATVQGKIWS